MKITRRQLLMGSAAGLVQSLSGCVAEEGYGSSCEDKHELTASGPITDIYVVQETNKGNIGGFKVKIDSAERVRTLDIRTPQGSKSKEIAPSAEPVEIKIDTWCWRRNAFTGCEGTEPGEYTIQLRENNSVFHRVKINVTQLETTERICIHSKITSETHPNDTDKEEENKRIRPD